jgi:hypothetical protein
LLDRDDRRGTLVPPTPTRLAPSVRVPAPFEWRDPRLRPCPVPHRASSAFSAPVSSEALFFPLPMFLAGEPEAFPLSELPAPTKVMGGWMNVSDRKVIDARKVPLMLVRLREETVEHTEGYQNQRTICQKAG